MKRLTGIAVAVLLAVPTTVAVQTGTDGSSFLLAFSVNLCRLLNRILDQSMRHSPLYAALALSIFGIPATASERFEQWSPEAQGEGTFAFAFRRPIRTQNSIGPGLAFICNQESKYVVAIVAPIPGTFKNGQESIPVAIQKSEDGYDPSDLLQRWENEGEYIFSEITGDQELPHVLPLPQ